MHLIFCIDDRDGLSFCGRRLSRDREVIAHMLRLIGNGQLWIHPYSANLFSADCVLADVDYLSKAGKNDYCFVEKGRLSDLCKTPESVILYHWNRTYPSTERFPRNLLDTLKLEFTEEFPGHSHEKITMERFVL